MSKKQDTAFDQLKRISDPELSELQRLINGRKKADQFEEFRGECEKWIKKLGLIHMDVDYIKVCSKHYQAEVIYDSVTKIAEIYVSKEKIIALSRAALHEVLHLLFWEMLNNKKNELSLEHDVINRLLNLLIPK